MNRACRGCPAWLTLSRDTPKPCEQTHYKVAIRRTLTLQLAEVKDCNWTSYNIAICRRKRLQSDEL